MTSTSVKGVNLFAELQTGQTGAAKGKRDGFSDCFQQLCDRDPGSNAQAAEAPKASVRASDKAAAAKDAAASKPLRSRQTAEARRPAAETVTEEEAAGSVQEAAEAIAAEIAAQMGLTPGDVLQAMQQMQMNPEELFTAEGIRALMLQLAGGEGQVDLLTNASLYQAVTNVLQTLEETLAGLEETTGLDAEQLKALLAQTAERPADGLQSQAQPETELPLETQPQDEEKTPVIQIEREPEAMRTADGPAQETVQTARPERQEGKEEHGGKENSQPKENFFQQTGAQEVRTAADAMVQEAGAAQESADTEQIMRQIMDYMKVQVKADMTQMEIRLHPASLGNINIQIASRNGVITAQFTAQNESVRAALETQLVQLKESLNEQGVKVEAVEVTIASHEFERNLEQNQQQPGDGQQESRPARGRRVQLNLTGTDGTQLEELLDGADDAERIAADMMARSGNTVDFSA